MAYPVGRPEGAPSVRETIPANTQPLHIVHGDMALRNVMMGTAEAGAEHHMGHVFKLIDFGAAREHRETRRGPASNLYQVGEVSTQWDQNRMLLLCSPPLYYNPFLIADRLGSP
jgi:hypothetical protein